MASLILRTAQKRKNKEKYNQKPSKFFIAQKKRSRQKSVELAVWLKIRLLRTRCLALRCHIQHRIRREQIFIQNFKKLNYKFTLSKNANTTGLLVLCGLGPTHNRPIQYSARSARLLVHNLFTSCIRRRPVSRHSIVDRARLPATEWCQRYLPCYLLTLYNSGLLFFHVGQQSCVLDLPNIGRR